MGSHPSLVKVRMGGNQFMPLSYIGKDVREKRCFSISLPLSLRKLWKEIKIRRRNKTAALLDLGERKKKTIVCKLDQGSKKGLHRNAI